MGEKSDKGVDWAGIGGQSSGQFVTGQRKKCQLQVRFAAGSAAGQA